MMKENLTKLGHPPVKPEKRFWRYVEKTPSCWIWTGAIDGGYGRFWDIKLIRAHRFSWQMCNGPIPNDLWVLHRCDNPACVNPSHLFLGTNQDNTKDRQIKNRGAKGVDIHQSKFTKKEVIEIRKEYKHKINSHRILAEKYGVVHSTIGTILRNKNWKHVPS